MGCISSKNAHPIESKSEDDKQGKNSSDDLAVESQHASSHPNSGNSNLNSIQLNGKDEGSDSYRKRYSLPQVENHIKSMVKKYGDDDLFEEELDAFQTHVQSPAPPTNSQNQTQNGKGQLDWNQVMKEFMSTDSPVVSAEQLSPLRGKGNNTSFNDSIFDDEFNLDSPGPSKIQKFSKTTADKNKFDLVTLTFEFQLNSNNEKTEGYTFPLPISNQEQKFIRYHSFSPRPIIDSIRKYGISSSDGYEALYCQFEPDVKEVKFSVDVEVASYRKDTSFCIGKKTFVCICDDRSERVQDIVKQQKWLQTETKEERIRQIAEYVGQLPYHLDLYDQIYYYLDSTHPSNHDGLRTVFHLFLSACDIKDSVDLSNLSGYIFPNLRENIFVKICYKELVKIEILNKSKDNELEEIYL